VREEAERLRLDAYLLKPVTKSMIIDTLVTIFAGDSWSDFEKLVQGYAFAEAQTRLQQATQPAS
jgi:YesN/AraC family two-component response regulator